MKAFKHYSLAALVAAAGALASCSSDDEITSGVDDNIQTGTIITTAIANEGSSVETRMGLQIGDGTDKNTLFHDDVVWAYSETGKWFNKLVPTFSKKDPGDTESTYESEGNTKFNADGEALLLIYTADKTTHTAAYEGTLDKWTLDRTKVHSHDLAYIHGAKDSIPYYDKNNAFSFKTAYGCVSSKGELCQLALKENGTETEVDVENSKGAINLISYMPLLRFDLPAAGSGSNSQKEINDVLSKLDYKIIIDAVPSSAGENVTSGFPQTVELTKITATAKRDNKNQTRPRAYHNCFLPTSITTGNSLKLYYKAGVKADDDVVKNGKCEPSEWLWHATTEDEDKGTWEEDIKNDDRYKGYVFIPIAPTKYTTIKVRVNVSYAGNETKLKTALETSGILGTYEFSKADNYSITADTKDPENTTNQIYKLGSIWSRNGTITYAPAANGAPRLAPAKVQPGEGWKKVSDADFDF